MIMLRVGILAATLLATLQCAVAGSPTEPSAPAPITLAQTDAPPSSHPLACCFGGTSSDMCTQSSPNQPGCEFVMAYNCGKAGYSCDPAKGLCLCNTAAADNGQ